MVITDPAVASARLLDLVGNYILYAVHVQQRSYSIDANLVLRACVTLIP